MTVIVPVLLVLGLFAWALWMLLGALRGPAAGEAAAGARAAAEPETGPAAVERARRAGEEDMRTAWIRWQLRPLPERPAERDPASTARTLAVVPKAEWDVARLREHGRDVWALRAGARLHDRQREVDARLDRVAAMISDLTGDEFDTGLGQTGEQYLYHPAREVRIAYLEGGGRGVEAIMDAVTAARAQIRQDAATRAAAESLVQQRNAALRALRELHPPTEARDARAAWDEEAGQIDP